MRPPQTARPRVLLAVGDDHAAFHRVEHVAEKERERRRSAERTDVLGPPAGAHCLAAVLEDRELGQIVQTANVAQHVRQKHASRARANLTFQVGVINLQREWVHVDQSYRVAGHDARPDLRRRGDRRHQDLVARYRLPEQMGDEQVGTRAAVDHDRIAPPDVLGEGFLECLDPWPARGLAGHATWPSPRRSPRRHRSGARADRSVWQLPRHHLVALPGQRVFVHHGERRRSEVVQRRQIPDHQPVSGTADQRPA